MTAKTMTDRKITAEGSAMQNAARIATRQARSKAFKVRKTILAEKDGWLVLIRKDGTVYRWVQELQPVVLPKR